MRPIWTIYAAAACAVALAATLAADSPLVVVLVALITIVVSWL